VASSTARSADALRADRGLRYYDTDLTSAGMVSTGRRWRRR
jgi:hypothetical protein